jgi:16S rRNA (guanine527-N7)-methyltransferase
MPGGVRDPVIPDEDFLEAETRQLFRRLEPFGISTGTDILNSITTYVRLLIAWNHRMALLSRHDQESIVRKHIAISLAPMLLREPTPDEKWVDVGTGAGLPGLVLKIWRPDLRITLIEGSRKKCVFLEEVVRTLSLERVEILSARVETVLARQEGGGTYDVMLVRAVADLASTLAEFAPLVRHGGTVITFKGPSWSEEVEAASRRGLLAPGQLEQVLKVPWTPGHLLCIRR